VEIKEETSPPNTGDGVLEVLSVGLRPDPRVEPLAAESQSVLEETADPPELPCQQEEDDVIDVKPQL
jgi:hypothetical protein